MRSLLLLSLVWIGAAPTAAQERRLSLAITDADSGQPLAARVYLRNEQHQPFFLQSLSADGAAVKYEVRRGGETSSSFEFHTTVSADPCFVDVPPGRYTLTVERGKTYFPSVQEIEVSDADVVVPIKLKRWIDMAAKGWYSGDTHIHRTLDELPTIVLAEDLNVVFPLTHWVTVSDTPPSAGNRNIEGAIPDRLMTVDDLHLIWPRNTEYEIFTTRGKRHTLGALFVLGHAGALEQTVPPWKPVIAAARKADPHVLFDMDKLAWPFGMVLPTLAPDAAYELANNHMWRTDFFFGDWYTPTPNYIQPPFGGTSGGERDWVDFTFGMYYTLLNCGFRLPPTAGTANGVHPVPAGFGRVYVHLPNGFDFEAWREGLQAGRSFVTTGPMLLATAAGKDPGHTFQADVGDPAIPVRVEVESETPLAFGELVVNGVPETLLRVSNERTESGAYRSVIETSVAPRRTGWFAVRFWEDRPRGRVRFAHSAPWYVSVDGKPPAVRHDERAYLVRRMRNEIQRSRGVVSDAGLREYESALEFYRQLPLVDDDEVVRRESRAFVDERDRQRWLDNMVIHHRFTPHELRLATGLSREEAEETVQRMLPVAQSEDRSGEIRLLPYPGGRHPRRGFLDGAIDPQRETKVSVFPAWENGGYVVIDVPEAIFSNLGLTYLAHEHVPTIWSEQGVRLEPLEWKHLENALEFERKLPNDIVFASRVERLEQGVAMRIRLTNGTDQPLTGLRVQVCAMLKGLRGFTSQRPREQVIHGPFVAVKADRGDRWLITAWKPLHRAWANPPVPCIHSDPIFPDCPPGQTVNVEGGLWFYEGEAVEAEIARLSAAWLTARPAATAITPEGSNR